MKHVLCLDGGGIKGKFSLGLISFIAQAHDEKPISHLFNLIVGVSVGAWIGAMIAYGFLDDSRERSRITQSISLELGDTFRERNVLGPLLAPKYSGQGKRDTLRRIFGDKLTLGDSKVPLVILCCSLGGAERVFCSWKKEHKHLLILDLLDASSAVPVYFPPVQFSNETLIDGGIIANKPLELAFMKGRELFGKDKNAFNLLSIGTQTICELKLKNDADLQSMGLVTWMNMGLFDILNGVANNLPVELMEDLLGDNFFRVSCNCALLTTDQLTVDADHTMVNSIQDTWTHHGNKIIQFLN